MGMRIGLLFSLTWFMGLTEPVLSVLGRQLSLRDLILVVGGLFLLAKSTCEIHGKLEAGEGGPVAKAAASFPSVLVQIMILDLVFSIDSVITAIGLADEIGVMVVAIVVSSA